MTINSTIRKAGPFIGNGTASSFPFTYKVFQASDLDVVRLNQSTNVETTLVLTTDYTVTLNQDQDSNPGGTVTLVAGALAAGYTLTMTSDVPNLQPTDLTNQGGFYPEVINDALDRATIQIQQLQEQTDRTLKVSISSTVDTTLPPPTANDLIGWNADGTALANIDPGSLASIVAYATAYADTFTGDGSTLDWVLTRDPGAIYNLDVSINGVTQVPIVDYTIAGATFSTTTAAPINSEILVKYREALPNTSGDSQDFRYLPAGTGAVATTVQAKLRQTVSVKDFGAKGDGIADDTSAIQAAMSAMSSYYFRRLYFPPGTYNISETLLPVVGLTSAEFFGGSGYDGIRGPINDSLRTKLVWTGSTNAAKAVVKFDRANGVVWKGISINCNYKAGYGLQFMSSTQLDPSCKNIVENLSICYALRDGIIVGEDGNPTANPGDRQFFGNVFRNLTMSGCARSAIHINEWNADQQMFDTVMAYLDDAPVPQNTLNMFWFDHGGQQSILINCQSGGMTVVPGVPSSGFAIKNKADDSSPYSTTSGAFGLTVIGFWQEGAGGLYYGVTSTNDRKSFLFENCRSFTSDTANRSVYIDKGTSDQIPYTFINCSFSSDIEIASSTFNKESLSIINCSAAPGAYVIDSSGKQITIQGKYTQIGITGLALTVPRFANLVVVTADSNIDAVYMEGVSKEDDEVVIVYTQDAVGNRTVNWTATGNISSLPLPPQPNTAAGAKSTYTFRSDGSKYYLTGVIKT